MFHQLKICVAVTTAVLLIASCGEEIKPQQEIHENNNTNLELDQASFTNPYFDSNQNNAFLTPDDLTNNDVLINPSSDARAYGD